MGGFGERFWWEVLVGGFSEWFWWEVLVGGRWRMNADADLSSKFSSALLLYRRD